MILICKKDRMYFFVDASHIPSESFDKDKHLKGQSVDLKIAGSIQKVDVVFKSGKSYSNLKLNQMILDHIQITIHLI